MILLFVAVDVAVFVAVTVAADVDVGDVLDVVVVDVDVDVRVHVDFDVAVVALDFRCCRCCLTSSRGKNRSGRGSTHHHAWP